MKALIAPNELVQLADGTTGQRLVEVNQNDFPVADPLFWVDCDDVVTAETHYWNGEAIVAKPLPPEPPVETE